MKIQPNRPFEEDLKDTALEIAANCVGSTVLENSLLSEKFSDAEMQAFNTKVANKIYTYLYYNFKCAPQEDVQCFLELVKLNHIADYNRPELDKDLVAAVENVKKLKINNR